MFLFLERPIYLLKMPAKIEGFMCRWPYLLSSFHATVYIYFNMVSDICIFSLGSKPSFHKSAYCPSFYILLYFSSGILFTFSVHYTLVLIHIFRARNVNSTLRFFPYICKMVISSGLNIMELCKGSLFLGNYSRSYSNTIIVHFQWAICILFF